MVALVGPSGGGKTTICNLIPRFYEISQGRITIDGQDIRHLTRRSLRAAVGIVSQDVFLFNGTIRENIAYGSPDATEEQIIDAARKANIHDYVEALEKGYDTDVGEGGDLLSTGEKQLISFARAILCDPRIAILDEATSSIDTLTERWIQEAIDKLMEGRTSFVIAHRLSTIRKADVILVVDDGKIVERGSHAELMKKRGHYYNLYTR